MWVCLEAGCPTLIDAGTRGGRCLEHTRQRERQRGTASARGYDHAHRKLRARYQRRMDRGESFTCWRCGCTIDPRAWHLGHDDHDRRVYRGPECVPCNQATAGRG
jgi:hypothetical protein